MIRSDILDTELTHLEASFVYTRGLGSRSEYIHLVGEVIGGDDAHDFLEKAAAETGQ